MELSNRLPLLFGLLILSACGGAKTEDLEVGLQFQELVVINTKAKSCSAQFVPGSASDLGSPKTTLGQISIVWKGPAPLQIQYMAFRTRSQGKVAETIVDSTELALIWKGPGGAGPVVLQPSDAAQFTSSLCQLEVGGVAVPALNKAAYGTGSVFIYGTTLKDGQSEAVSQEISFSWHFDAAQ